MRRRPHRTVIPFAPVALALMLTGCVRPTAIDELAKSASLAAGLFPAVAAIPYDSCVATEKYRQLAGVTEFRPDFDFDQTAVATACGAAQKTSARLAATYQVLSVYIATLDKLAGGTPPTYDKSIKSIVGNVSDLNAAQQGAVTGLASLIADVADRRFRQAEAAKAIHLAQPFVHELSAMLRTQLPAGLDVILTNEQDRLASLYQDIAVFRLNGVIQRTSPRLATSLFVADRTSVQNRRAAVAAFEKILAGIDEAHSALDRQRNRLSDRETMAELFQTATAITTQVVAVQTAFAR